MADDKKINKDLPERQSISFKLEGIRTPPDLLSMLLEAVAELENRDIELVKNCWLYVTPIDEIKKGKKVDSIVIKSPYRSAADQYGL